MPPENDELSIENEEAGELKTEEAATGETPEAEDAEATEEADAEVVVMIGDEVAEPDTDEEHVKSAPQWVRDLRKENRENKKRIKELEAAQQKPQEEKPAAIETGKKPTLESCDYDTEKFETELDDWKERKRQADKQAEQKDAEEKAARDAWQARLEGHKKAKAELKVPDFDEAEEAVKEAFSATQQGVIVHGADNSALLIYALGKNPKKLKELAAIKDPVKFAFSVAKLETQLKVAPKKTPPPPEKVLKGGAPVSGNADSNLDRLRKEAEKTGNYQKVIEYKKKLRAK